jgi:O-antigen/teichoic acid export membrane protein
MTLTEIASTSTSLGTAVACAVAGFGVWALVWQQIVFFAVRLTLTLALSPFRPRLIFDVRDASEHIIFGRNLLGATLISSGSRALESFLIGRLCGSSPLGVYSMAFQFARLPFMLVTGPLQYVLYPYIAALRDDKAKLAGLFLVLTRVLALVVCPAVGVIAAASDPVFHLLLTKKWGHAAPIFVLIAPAAALQPVTAILSTFLMGLGRTDVQMRLAGQLAAVWLVGLTLSVWHGIEAVAVAYSICVFLFSLCWTLRIGLPLVDCSFKDYAHALLWPLTLTVSAALLYRMVRFTAPADEVMNVCLAAALAITASALALIAQRHALLAALSFPAKGV